ENQNTGFTSRRNTPAAPAQGENIRRPSAKARGRQRALTRMETAMNVVSGSRKKILITRANATKNGYPGGWGWWIRGSNFSSANARFTLSTDKYEAIAGSRVNSSRASITTQKVFECSSIRSEIRGQSEF